MFFKQHDAIRSKTVLRSKQRDRDATWCIFELRADAFSSLWIPYRLKTEVNAFNSTLFLKKVIYQTGKRYVSTRMFIGFSEKADLIDCK